MSKFPQVYYERLNEWRKVKKRLEEHDKRYTKEPLEVETTDAQNKWKQLPEELNAAEQKLIKVEKRYGISIIYRDIENDKEI